MTVVTLYGRPDCCLCDEAKAAIESVRGQREFELREVDVSLDPELEGDYGERVPVVEVDGVEAFQYRVAPEELEDRLDRVTS